MIEPINCFLSRKYFTATRAVPTLGFAWLGTSCSNRIINNLYVTKSSDGLLRNNHLITYRAVLALSLTVSRTSRSNGRIHHFRMRKASHTIRALNNSSANALVPIISKRNGIPLLNRSIKIKIFQRSAARECICTYARHARGYFYASKRGAVAKH
jgi:hypothetical protein